jgi:hypothetical protein
MIPVLSARTVILSHSQRKPSISQALSWSTPVGLSTRRSAYVGVPFQRGPAIYVKRIRPYNSLTGRFLTSLTLMVYHRPVSSSRRIFIRYETDSVCDGTKAFTASYCSCPGSPPIEGPMCTLCPRGEAAPDPNRTLSVQGIPFETCGEAEKATALYLSQGSGICTSFRSISPLVDARLRLRWNRHARCAQTELPCHCRMWI